MRGAEVRTSRRDTKEEDCVCKVPRSAAAQAAGGPGRLNFTFIVYRISLWGGVWGVTEICVLLLHKPQYGFKNTFGPYWCTVFCIPANTIPYQRYQKRNRCTRDVRGARASRDHDLSLTLLMGGNSIHNRIIRSPKALALQAN